MTPDVFNWCHPPQIDMESRKHSRILTNIYKPFVPCTYAPVIKLGNGKNPPFIDVSPALTPSFIEDFRLSCLITGD